MLNFLKKKPKKSTQPVIEEISSAIKTVANKPQVEESFIERKPHKIVSEATDPVKTTEKIYKVPSYKESPMVTFLTSERINSPYLIPAGKSKLTGYEIYRYTGDSPKIIHGICFEYGCEYEEIIGLSNYIQV
jgi:hypothetical protein